MTPNYFHNLCCHLSENVDEIVVTWSTLDATNESIVEYIFNGQESIQNGESKLFIDGGDEKHQQYIHVVRIDAIIRCYSNNIKRSVCQNV